MLALFMPFVHPSIVSAAPLGGALLRWPLPHAQAGCIRYREADETERGGPGKEKELQ